MTYLEKYLEDHPNMNKKFVVNTLCPAECGFSDTKYRTINCKDDASITCKKCWNQEISEDKEKSNEPTEPCSDGCEGVVRKKDRFIEMIQNIETILLYSGSDVIWSIFHNPDTKSYTIDIRREEEEE